jgi:peptidoglycan/LPS O-acetylase OafA/YrhL
MSPAQLSEIVLVVAVLGWIVYRQTRWQVLDPARIWRMPIILAVVGLISLRSTPADGGTLDGVVVALLVGTGLLSIGVGALMGLMSQLRVADGRWQARTGWAGSLLWLVLIAVRIGVDVGASALGAKIVASTGVILLMVALNRIGRNLVLVRRADLGGPAVAGRSRDVPTGGPGRGY